MVDAAKLNEIDEYDYDEAGCVRCPRCDGFGTVPCHCGGDLCVCQNNGEAPCPVCGGDGEITEERYERYEKAQRQMAEVIRRAIEGGAECP